MTTKFTEHSEIQVYVENTVNMNGDELIDTLYINVDASNLEVTFSIEDSQGDSADFKINKEALQQVFDWLKIKHIVQ